MHASGPLPSMPSPPQFPYDRLLSPFQIQPRLSAVTMRLLAGEVCPVIPTLNKTMLLFLLPGSFRPGWLGLLEGGGWRRELLGLQAAGQRRRG